MSRAGNLNSIPKVSTYILYSHFALHQLPIHRVQTYTDSDGYFSLLSTGPVRKPDQINPVINSRKRASQWQDVRRTSRPNRYEYESPYSSLAGFKNKNGSKRRIRVGIYVMLYDDWQGKFKILRGDIMAGVVTPIPCVSVSRFSLPYL